MIEKIFVATSNPGKIRGFEKAFSRYEIAVLSPKDFDIQIDVKEDGETLEENAEKKVCAYREHISDMLIIADDTALHIDAFEGEPGIFVRRWSGSHMEDEEIIEYCLEKMKEVPAGDRTAKFRSVVALSLPETTPPFGHPSIEGNNTPSATRPPLLEKGVLREDVLFFDGVLHGEIVEHPLEKRVKGFPFEPLFFIPKWGKFLYDIHMMPPEESENFPLHRDLAVYKTIRFLKKLPVSF